MWGEGLVGNIDSLSSDNSLHFTAFNNFWEYDSETDFWTSKKELPDGERAVGVGFALGDKGYIGLGADNSLMRYTDFYEYNPNSNDWSFKTSYTGNARGFAIAIVNQRLEKVFIGLGAEFIGFDLIWYNEFFEFSTQ